MSTDTLIASGDRSSSEVLADVRALIRTHGHDSATYNADTPVPLRLREAINLALGVGLKSRIIILTQSERALIDKVWHRLEVALADMPDSTYQKVISQPTVRYQRLAQWLIHADTSSVLALIDYALDERP